MNFRDKNYFLQLFEVNKPDYCPAILVFEGEGVETYHLLYKDGRFSQFMFLVRKTRKLPPEEAFFFLANNYILNGNARIGDVYDNHKSDDEFLHITVTKERVFG